MTTIEENNLLIAWFMTEEPEVLKRDLLKAGTVESMHYHDQWDWLMDVVENIRANKMCDNLNINIFGDCIIEGINFDIHIDCDKNITTIDATWLAVVEFIKWYNKENKINN